MHLKTLANKKQIYNVYRFFKQSAFLLSLLYINIHETFVLQDNPYIYEVQLTILTRHNLPSLDWPVMKAWKGGWGRTLELVTMTARAKKKDSTAAIRKKMKVKQKQVLLINTKAVSCKYNISEDIKSVWVK